MITITGKIEDAAGATRHATINFASQSTPLVANGVVITNTDKTIRTNPSDGTFSLQLASGNYQVTVIAQGRSSSFNISVPSGDDTVSIETLVTTPLVYPYVAPNMVWNGKWAGNITFLPIAPPPAPTFQEITYAGGHIDDGEARYAYWVSYVTETGETAVSEPLNIHFNSGSPIPNKAIRLNLQANPTGVTSVRIWRSYADNGHIYNAVTFPKSVGLLATVSPSSGHYDDWESTDEFAARVSAEVPPLFNTSAGQLLSSNGTLCAFVTDQGLFFPGTNCRIKPGQGLQIYNFSTQLWHTLLNTGNPAQWGFDAGNPN